MNKMANALATTPNPANTSNGYKVWADVCAVTITGRVMHVEKVTNNSGDYLSFTVITNTQDDDATGTSVKFTTSQSGMMKMFDGGYIPNGRRVTLIGSIKEVRNSYVNSDGVVVALKRPEITLRRVDINLGALPKAK